MLTKLSTPQKALAYFVLALAFCTAVIALTPLLGDVALKLVMATPLAAVLTMFFVVTRDGLSRDAWRDLGLHRAGLSGWPLAFFVPLIVLSFAYGVVWLTGIAALVVPAVGNLPLYLLDIVASVAIVTLLGGIGEEIGWRGYMLPRLLSLGVRPALLLTGFAHGLFHLPAILGTTLYHAGANPLFVVPLFLATLTMAGVCYGYLRLTTGSVWPAAIAHSAFNIFWDRLNAFTATDAPARLDYLAGESGILTLAALTAVAAWLAYRLPARA